MDGTFGSRPSARIDYAVEIEYYRNGGILADGVAKDGESLVR